MVVEGEEGAEGAVGEVREVRGVREAARKPAAVAKNMIQKHIVARMNKLLLVSLAKKKLLSKAMV